MLCHHAPREDCFVQLGPYKCRHRYWTNGVAPAGAGKSPSMKPFMRVLLEVLAANPAMAVGIKADDFHAMMSTTTAAAIDKLRACSAYTLAWSTDAGRCLSQKFAAGGAAFAFPLSPSHATASRACPA